MVHIRLELTRIKHFGVPMIHIQFTMFFFMTLWDTAGLLANDNYSTPTVNNIYSSRLVVQVYSGERVVE